MFLRAAGNGRKTLISRRSSRSVAHFFRTSFVCRDNSYQGGFDMEVRQSAVNRTAGFEDFVEHFYLDANAKVTVGYGHMLADSDAAASTPMKLDGNPASEQDKRDEWTLINSKEPGHRASYYKQFTKLA